MEIDLVITWVDGHDPAWRAQFERVSKAVGFVPNPREFAVRYDSYDDLAVAIETLDKFAKDVFRKVWIVHDPIQTPRINRDYISLVSHSEIMPADMLPTFHSKAIEPYLYRIPGLSKNFVYSNDDCYFKGPVSRETFFEGDRPRVFASRPVHALSDLEGLPREEVAWQHTLAYTNTVLNRYFTPDYPCDKYLRIHPAHIQSAHTIEICQKSWEIFYDELSEQGMYRIRGMATAAGKGLASTSMLFQWVGLELGLATFSRRPIEALGFRDPQSTPDLPRLA